MKHYLFIPCYFFGPFLAIILSLEGCAVKPSSPQEPPSSAQEQPLQDKPAPTLPEPDDTDQEAFYQIAQELFLEESSSRPSSFGDLSLTSWNQHLEVLKDFDTRLNAVNPEKLSPDLQEAYDILSFYIDIEQEKQGMEYLRLLEILSPETGIVSQIPKDLTQFSLSSRQDIEEYFLLLADLPRVCKEMIDLAKEGIGKGIILTEQWQQDMAEACNPYLLPPPYNSLSFSFSRKISSVSSLTQEEIQAYQEKNQEMLNQYLIPAYTQLKQDILDLPVNETKKEGLCGQTQGRAYYRYLVFRNTGTSYPDIRQLKGAIEEQLSQNMQSIEEILSEHPHLSQDIHYSREIFSDSAQTLSFLAEETKNHFPLISFPQTNVEVVPSGYEDLWNLPCWQSLFSELEENEKQILIREADAVSPDLFYPALAQVGYPGSLYRETFLQQRGVLPVLSAISFPGWEKGWDTYAKSYAISFDNGFSQEARQLARLSLSSYLAAQALIDIQVNYYGWGQEETEGFLSQYYHMEKNKVTETLYKKVIYSPTDSLSAYTGYLEIRQIKSIAQQALEEQFDEMAFHQFLLDHAPAPFSQIREHLDEWIVLQRMEKIGG